MCSITDQVHHAARGARLATLIRHTHELTTAISADLLAPDVDSELAAMHVDAVAAHARGLLAAADAARASAAVLTGVLDLAVGARQLIDGTYASTKRWLEVESGMSATAATVTCVTRPTTVMLGCGSRGCPVRSAMTRCGCSPWVCAPRSSTCPPPSAVR